MTVFGYIKQLLGKWLYKCKSEGLPADSTILKIWDSHSNVAENSSLLGCDATSPSILKDWGAFKNIRKGIAYPTQHHQILDSACDMDDFMNTWCWKGHPAIPNSCVP